MFQDQQEYQPELWETPYETSPVGSPLDEIMGQPVPGFQPEGEWESPFGEYPSEYEAAYPSEYEAEYPGEYAGEYGAEYAGEYAGEFAGEYAGEYQEFVSEDEELALAAELMEVRTDEELEQFLGNLFKKVVRGARSFIRSPAGQMLGNVLRQVAKKYVIPMGARAIGGLIGGPPGALIAGQLAGPAAQALGLEVGGLSEEEAQFSIGRQFVRLAYDAARRAAAANPQLDPNQVARFAVTQAARRFAPGLLSPAAPPVPVASISGRSRGVWVRRGQTIVLFGV